MTLKTGVVADENSALHHRIFFIYICFLVVFFYQINTALKSIRDSIKT